MHNFPKNFAGAWGDRGHTHTVSVAQRHIGLLQEWSANLHFVMPCLGAVCTGFTSPRWKEANYSQITLRQSAPTSFCLCCLQAQGWTAFTTLHFEKITLSGCPTNLTCLQHFFFTWIKKQGANRGAEGKVTACCLGTSALQCLCWIHPQGYQRKSPLFCFFEGKDLSGRNVT